MKKSWARTLLVVIVIPFLMTAGILLVRTDPGFAQESTPTEVIPTVTGTPGGPIVTVRADSENTQINVRSGPGTDYEKVGILLIGQSAAAKGKTAGGKWIMIEYYGVPGGVGWVYTSLVDLSPGALPVVEPPPTPTPAVTNTIDPTLAARFVITPLSTRMPTYTVPPPLVIPTFHAQSANGPEGIPVGLIIIALGGAGILIGLFSLAQGR